LSIAFKDLPLSETVLKGIEDMGFTNATPIQEQVIPHALMGRDVCALAQTGSGKTAAYTIPILDILTAQRKRAKLPRCLILVPTRELAQQVSESFDALGKYFKDFGYAVIIGGESPYLQEKSLRQGVDVVIATPGRLLDQYERGNVSFLDISLVVIDEADRMLDMGFVPDIEKLMSFIAKPNCQKLCLSATMPKPIQVLVDNFLVKPKQIEIEGESMPADSVEQAFIYKAGKEREKRQALRELIKLEKIEQAIIFCNRKVDVDILANSLKRYKINAGALHGDMTQGARVEMLDAFKEKKVDYLIASDVAARGIDIVMLPFVINYDVPVNADEYVHRVGRTGRAGNKGKAFTFVDDVKSMLYKRLKPYIPEGARTIDASTELENNPFKEIGFLKPTDVKGFKFNAKSVTGFGEAEPAFMRAGL